MAGLKSRASCAQTHSTEKNWADYHGPQGRETRLWSPCLRCQQEHMAFARSRQNRCQQEALELKVFTASPRLTCMSSRAFWRKLSPELRKPHVPSVAQPCFGTGSRVLARVYTWRSACRTHPAPPIHFPSCWTRASVRTLLLACALCRPAKPRCKHPLKMLTEGLHLSYKQLNQKRAMRRSQKKQLSACSFRYSSCVVGAQVSCIEFMCTRCD